MWTNVDEIETLIQNYASTYPAIAERIALPEQAISADSGVAPRTVSALRIGTNTANSADGALMVFGHHAREWVPPEVALEMAGAILTAYSGSTGITYGGKTYSAADVQRIVQNINLFLVPCINPHGRQYSLDYDTQDAGWRKSRGKIPSSTQIGIDLNRNYDFVFDLTKYFDTANSAVLTYTSEQPAQIVYQGPSPFSEPETRDIRWLLDTYPRIRWFVDIHGFTLDGEIYYPFGDDQNQSADPAMNWRNSAYDGQRGKPSDNVREYMRAEDQATHAYLAKSIKDGADPVNGRSYLVEQSFALYPTAGCSNDYAWTRHLISPFSTRVEGFAIEHRASMFKPASPEREEVISEVASGLINFCLACSAGVPGLSVELKTQNIVFNHCPVGLTSSRAAILEVTGSDAATFRVSTGPTRTGGPGRVNFGIAVGSQAVPAVSAPVTRDLYVWLTCSGGHDGDTATGTVKVECPEANFSADIPINADFVAAPVAGAVLVLDRSGSMTEDAGDGRTRLEVLKDSAPVFVNVAPQGAHVGLVRFATHDFPGAPMTIMGPEGPDPAGRDVILAAIASHTVATGADQFTSIGDGVYAANTLIAPEGGVDFKSLVVLTDGFENRPKWIADVGSLINGRVFAIGLGTPDQIQPIALDALTNGTNGYLLMTGDMDPNDPNRLAKYYLQILTGVTNDQVVLDPGGWLPFGGSETIPFYLNEADASVDAIVLAPAPELLRIRLQAPSGQILDQTNPAMTFARSNRMAFYRFALPVPGSHFAEGAGRWAILLDWAGKIGRAPVRPLAAAGVEVSAQSMRYDAIVSAHSAVEMTASLVQDKLTPGAKVSLRVGLTQYGSVPIDDARVTARVSWPDGSSQLLSLAAQGQGVFQTTFNASMTGIYPVRVTAEGRTLRGFHFTREAVRTAMAWAGGDSKPPTHHDDSWCSFLRCLVETKALDPELLKRLGVDVSSIGKCCEVEEPAGGGKR
jgi:murein tripeptide amidase MpaA